MSFRACTLIAAVGWLAATAAGTAAPVKDGFRFEDGPTLPTETTEGAMGRALDDLLAVGADRTVYFLPVGGDAWAEAGRWEDAPEQVETAETDRGLVALGDGDTSPPVLLTVSDGALQIDPLPSLPFAVAGIRAVGIGHQVYVAGRRAEPDSPDDANAFLRLDLASRDLGWTPLPSWPGPARSRPGMMAYQDKVVLLGGVDDDTALSDGYLYDQELGWSTLESAPQPLGDCRAFACGLSHVLVAGGALAADELKGYHAITDTWVTFEPLPRGLTLLGASGHGTRFTLVGAQGVLRGEAVLTPTKYGWLDHGVVLLYLVGMLFVGAFLARREKGSSDYFRGGQRIPWWASGLSLFATGASAISLMAMPGKSFAGDWTYFSISIYSALLLPLGLYVYVPIARRLKVATGNEYLERRFNLSIRLFGGVIFSLNQMLARMATIMLLPSIALSAIVGLPMETSILIMGGVTTIYVTLGGLEAVVWTDVIQALVMLLSVLVCIVWALVALRTDLPVAMQILNDGHKLAMFDWGWSLVRPTVWLMSANIFVTVLGGIGDQNFIQRVQCTPSERDARKAVIMQISVAVPLNVVLFSLGTVLFLFYREHADWLNPALKTDGIYPLFAAQMLPPGMAGLVVASLLAATMSTLSSAVNSVANVGVEDFYRRLAPRTSDHTILVMGRALSVGLGIFGTMAALVLARTSLSSIWDLAVLVTGVVAAPIAGIITLGIFTRRANSAGVLIGSAAAIAMAVYAKYGMTVHPFFNLTAGVVTCIVVGYVASLLIPSAPRDLKGLTIYTLDPSEDE